jgi:hypothetical protein
MNSKVKVVADELSGKVIVVSQNNPEWGYVRLEQQRTEINKNGFVDNKNVSILMKGRVTDLEKSNFVAGQELPGTIYIVEQLSPFDTEYPDRDLKIAGETGIICKKDGKSIYRKTFYTPVDNAPDGERIQHDNVEELRAAYAVEKSKAISANTDFDNL